MNTKKYIKKQSPGDWHRADIVAALHKIGWSLRRLSAANGFSPMAVSQALHKQYPNAEKIIADVLNLHPMTIWPSRYDKQGEPIRKRRGRKPKNK